MLASLGHLQGKLSIADFGSTLGSRNPACQPMCGGAGVGRGWGGVGCDWLVQ